MSEKVRTSKLIYKVKLVEGTKYNCFLCEKPLVLPLDMQKGDEGKYTTNNYSVKLNRTLNLQDEKAHWNDIAHCYFCGECYRSMVQKVIRSVINEKKSKTSTTS